MPDCRYNVIERHEDSDSFTITGEIAHIVAQEPGGPRGDHHDRSNIDEYSNLLLLCEKCHKVIDTQLNAYTVERLHQIKKDHEKWVSSRLSPDEKFSGVTPPRDYITDRVQSTLLPVTNIPMYVYIAPCDLTETEVKEELIWPEDRKIIFPYLVREKKLISFCDLRKYKNNPFGRAIDPHTAERLDAISWWDDPDYSRWYMALLNRSLNKLTGRKQLNLDKDHFRYYFEPERDENGKPATRNVRYKALKGSTSTRQVAWRPTFRYKEGSKNHWEHLAVSLHFHRVDNRSWCLSIRPERRFTRDGYITLAPKTTGKRSTSRHAKLYNIGVLQEVHFWREYLSEGKPRIILHYGNQALVIDNEMVHTKIEWPGVPDDAKTVTNVRHEDDLFTLAEHRDALEDDFDEDLDLEEDEYFEEE